LRDVAHYQADLYELPANAAAAPEALIRYRLGSHMFFREQLAANGTKLSALPFAGAVYRTGHGESISASRRVLRNYVFRRAMLRRPDRLVVNAATLRLLSGALRREYFGEPPADAVSR
jgi:hypothetical protein